jgi:Ca2+-binding RTX toxin-like protein
VAKPWTTLRPYDGEAATLVGRLVVSVKARHSIVEGLDLNGWRPKGKSQSLMVFGDWATVRDNTITNDWTAICVHVSSYYGDRARGVTIAGNEISGCGATAHQNHDHGIYVAEADGTQILDNFIHDNQDRGIQLWPDADGSLVEGNVVDHNGEGISIGGQRRRGPDLSSDDNTVRGNVIMRSHANYADPDGPGPIQSNTHGWNLEFVRNGAGSGNLIERNCFYADHPDPYYDTNGGINLADTDGRPVSFRLGVNAVPAPDANPAPPPDPTEQSPCGDSSLLEGAVFRSCIPPLMNQWTGGAGPDRFDGTDLRDYANGAEGDDVVGGAGAADCLLGGPGNDLLSGGAARDQIWGEDGDDVIVAREPDQGDWSSDQVSCGPGLDVVYADISDDVGPDCETPLYREP